MCVEGEEGESGRERMRGMIGVESQTGRAEARSVPAGFKGEGWAWRRRWESCRQWGRGDALI